MKINFTVNGQPIGKARPRVTRTVTYTPAKTSKYEDLVRYAALNSFEGIIDRDQPISVKIMAYFQLPKRYSKTRRIRCLSGEELPAKNQISITSLR